MRDEGEGMNKNLKIFIVYPSIIIDLEVTQLKDKKRN